MTIQELREKRAKAWDTARDFLDSKRQADGTLSEEDSKTYDAMEATIVNLGKEIQRMERQAEIEAEMTKATSTPILTTPTAQGMTSEKTGTASAEYSAAFWNSIRNRNYMDIRNAVQPRYFGEKGSDYHNHENIVRGYYYGYQEKHSGGRTGSAIQGECRCASPIPSEVWS